VRRQPWKYACRRKVTAEAGLRIEQAWRHEREDALLALHRPRSRNADWHDRIGYWLLVKDGLLQRRRPVYGRRPRGVSWRWANKLLAVSGDVAVQRGQMLPDAVRTLPVQYDELPPVLTRHDTHRGIPTSLAVSHVPMSLPLLPPHRLLSRRFSNVVMSREEACLFCDLRTAWTSDHPWLSETDHADDLMALVMGGVMLHRIGSVAARTNAIRHWQIYHSAFNRCQRKRECLGLAGDRSHRSA
jgi:hypothetical protein